MIKSDGYPVQRTHMTPQCTAHSKRSGILCKNPAVRGWVVFRMHGAGGGQTSGMANSQWVHGLRGGEYTKVRKLITELSRMANQ